MLRINLKLKLILIFLSLRNLTAIVRLDNAKKYQYFKIEPINAFMGKTTLSFPPNPLPQKRKLLCQKIHGLPFYRPSQFGIWTVFAFPSQTAFQRVRLLKRRLAAS